MDLVEQENRVRASLHRLRDVFDSLEELCPLNDNFSISLSYGGVILGELQSRIHELFLLLKLIPKPRIPSLVGPHQLSDWILKGEGNFGKVYECRLQGARVAVKILKDRASSSFLECHLLRELHHDNIVAFRGMGLVSDHDVIQLVDSSANIDLGSGQNVSSTSGHILPQSNIDSDVFVTNPKSVSTSEPSTLSDSDVATGTGLYSKESFSMSDNSPCNVGDSWNPDPRGYIDEASIQSPNKLIPNTQTSGNAPTDVQKDPTNSHQEVKKHVSSNYHTVEQLQTGHFGIYQSSTSSDRKEITGQVQTCLTRTVLCPKSKEVRHQELTSHGIAVFVVMEYVDMNLIGYLRTRPISYANAWDISNQIFHAIAYLHSNDVTHRDLKPDNILVEVWPSRLRVKVADFGLAWGSGIEKLTASPFCNYGLQEGPRRGYVHVRWGAPEFVFRGKADITFSLQDYKRGDIYSFGLVTGYAISGVKAINQLSTGQLMSVVRKGGRIENDETKDGQVKDENYMSVSKDKVKEYSYSANLKKKLDTSEQFIGDFVSIPEDLSGPLLDVIESCLKHCPSHRPTTEELYSDYFLFKSNPYENNPTIAEYFSFGFLKNTHIYVADSFCSEPGGFYNTGIRNAGYDHTQLMCEIETSDIPEAGAPDSWNMDKRDLYIRTAEKYRKLAAKKDIDNNVLAALKKVTFSRSGINECQTINLHFQESLYCHHRTMRDIWMSFSDREKDEAVPCKSVVSSFYSNSFGLHVAVLTNEGPECPQKFVFTQRSRKSAISSPGLFTCGIVESVSSPDKCLRNSQHYVDLVNTAARGLKEEIGIVLTGSDLDAISLTTVYLKFDYHEWGLCGFVDLLDERIAEQHRLSAENIKARFTSGPKDKFEHQNLTFVDFRLDSMVKFASQNHENFASSAKLVMVNVLEAFFGTDCVERAFQHVSE